jgi:hypothetical protein
MDLDVNITNSENPANENIAQAQEGSKRDLLFE